MLSCRRLAVRAIAKPKLINTEVSWPLPVVVIVVTDRPCQTTVGICVTLVAPSAPPSFCTLAILHEIYDRLPAQQKSQNGNFWVAAGR